ncbi:UNVERIFIED_CONTAM: propanol-preferring alcohol dehydrogenase [Williamsia faeni]
MPTMRALQYREFGARPEVVEIARPVPGAGEVLLKMTASGACHSDEFIMSTPEDQYVFAPLPLTLGHEGAGVVAELGPGTTGVEVGDAVLVYGPWGCGVCHSCAQGSENNCVKGISAPGIHRPGTMAEYLIVDDVRHLVPLGDLDPIPSVSLTDAGLTPYHAVKPSISRLIPGTTALVIGVGGLGHVGVQLLKALTQASIIAVDINPASIEHARELGADHAFASDTDAAARIRELTDGRGADVVFDFVGAEPTAALAQSSVAVAGEIVMIGVSTGAVPVGYLTVPFDVSVRVVNWGTRAELIEVVELARRGAIEIAVEEFSMADAPVAYERLHAGEIRGRAVVVPTR